MRFVSFAPRAIVLFVWAGLLTRYESAMEIGCVGDLLCLRGLTLDDALNMSVASSGYTCARGLCACSTSYQHTSP